LQLVSDGYRWSLTPDFSKAKMPSVPTPSKSGIVEDATGERHIPASVRADGSVRKEIKIKPGYKPPEDVEVYKNRTAEGFRSRGKGGVPGAEGLKDDTTSQSAASNKNAKRREARKKAKTTEDSAEGQPVENGTSKQDTAAEEKAIDPEAEREKKARNLKKKLKQARELKEKGDGGAALLPEQFAKVIKINELIRELDALGFDADGEPKA
jgi:partner of Y14 and mago protein